MDVLRTFYTVIQTIVFYVHDRYDIFSVSAYLKYYFYKTDNLQLYTLTKYKGAIEQSYTGQLLLAYYRKGETNLHWTTIL